MTIQEKLIRKVANDAVQYGYNEAMEEIEKESSMASSVLPTAGGVDNVGSSAMSFLSSAANGAGKGISSGIKSVGTHIKKNPVPYAAAGGAVGGGSLVFLGSKASGKK